MDYFIQNKKLQKFELTVDGLVSYISYEVVAGVYHLPHTVVPKEIGGRGVASKLAQLTFEFLLNNNLKALPICPFLIKFVEKNKQFGQIVVDS